MCVAKDKKSISCSDRRVVGKENEGFFDASYKYLRELPEADSGSQNILWYIV